MGFGSLHSMRQPVAVTTPKSKRISVPRPVATATTIPAVTRRAVRAVGERRSDMFTSSAGRAVRSMGGHPDCETGVYRAPSEPFVPT